MFQASWRAGKPQGLLAGAPSASFGGFPWRRRRPGGGGRGSPFGWRCVGCWCGIGMPVGRETPLRPTRLGGGDRVDGFFAGSRLACRGPGGTRGTRERPRIRLRGCRVRPTGRTRRTAYCSGGGAARLRMDSPLSSMRYALCTTRSRMASARVPSPTVRYQSSMGSWLAMAMDFLW